MSDRSSQHVFVPRRWLRNAHAQTLAGNFLPRINLLAHGEQRIFEIQHSQPEEHRIAVMCLCHWQQNRHSAPTVVIVHGLEGSSDSQYVVGTGSKAWAAGMNVVRMNMRNCGGTETLTPTLYHSGMSGDVASVLRSLVRQDKLECLAAVGYSMGGNLVLKLAGEYGNTFPPELRAVCAVSPAMDLAASADALHRWQNRIYEARFLRNLKRRFRRKAKLFPARYQIHHLPRLASIREFDHYVTARYEGFLSADDYYSQSSSSRLAERISLPTLIVHASDDPFIRLLPQTRNKLHANPNVALVETQHGGHCAFLETPNGYDGRWAERLVIDFIRQQC